MDNSIILLVGLMVTLLLFGGVAYTVIEFRRMYHDHEEEHSHEEPALTDDDEGRL